VPLQMFAYLAASEACCLSDRRAGAESGAFAAVLFAVVTAVCVARSCVRARLVGTEGPNTGLLLLARKERHWPVACISWMCATTFAISAMGPTMCERLGAKKPQW
jgi:hypothetical protein